MASSVCTSACRSSWRCSAAHHQHGARAAGRRAGERSPTARSRSARAGALVAERRQRRGRRRHAGRPMSRFPAAWRAAQPPARVPFVFWAALWPARQRTAAHLAALPLMAAHLPRVRPRSSPTAPTSASRTVRAAHARAHRAAGGRQRLLGRRGRRQRCRQRASRRLRFVGRAGARLKGLEIAGFRRWQQAGIDGTFYRRRGKAWPAARRAADRFRVGSIRRELRNLYGASDVVVVPSIASRRFIEPWGLVVNEAMNQGTAIIASDAVGAVAGGLVRDGHNGLRRACGRRARALAAAALRALARRSRALRGSSGAAGRERCPRLHPGRAGAGVR